jgi:tripartite-type tricarboxylate transporter receptor subunit TctC
LGQTVYVENMPGAGSMVGTRQLVQAPKDGHTIMLVNNALAINPSIIKQMPYDSVKDVTPIGTVGHVPLVLLVNPSVPANNLSELIALAKSKPGGLTFGSNGLGTIIHLAGLMLANEAGIDIKHVPYKEGGQMYTDLIAGRIDFAFPASSILLPHIQSGKLRALAVTTQTRSKLLPDVPTMQEAGLPNYLLPGWMVLIGPAGLPAPVVDRLQASFKSALAQPQMKDVLANQDLTYQDSTPHSTGQFIQSEVRKYDQLVKKFNVIIE